LWKSDTNYRSARQGLQAGKISVCGIIYLLVYNFQTGVDFFSLWNISF